MKTSTECPACRGRLSLWTGFRAPTPLQIRCPHCQTILRTQMRGLWLPVVAGIALFVLLGWGLVEVFVKARALPVAALIFVAAGIAGELVVGVILYTYAKFEPKVKPQAVEPDRGGGAG